MYSGDDHLIERGCMSWTAPAPLVMVIINNPTLIDSILEVSEFSQRHVGSITSAGRSDKRTCMMIADIPSLGAIET